jgi:plastocyanin
MGRAIPLLFAGWITATAALPVNERDGAAQDGSRGSVAGRVVAAAGSLPEMIVYLEPVDPRAASATAAPEKVEVISQKGAKFAPSLLVIARGQTVEFRNDEQRPVEHNVFSRSPAKPFDLGLFPPPQAKRVTFTEPGPVQLYCSIHRYMDGVIYVCPTPHFAKVGVDGSFNVENVPPGEWRVRTWQRSARFDDVEQVVRVESGAVRTMNLEMKRE